MMNTYDRAIGSISINSYVYDGSWWVAPKNPAAISIHASTVARLMTAEHVTVNGRYLELTDEGRAYVKRNYL